MGQRLNVKEGRTYRTEKMPATREIEAEFEARMQSDLNRIFAEKKPCTCKPADSLHQRGPLTCEPKPFRSRPKSTAEREKDGSAYFPASPGPSKNHTEPSPYTWAGIGSDSFA